MYLIEANGRHSPHVQLLLEVLGEAQLLGAEAVVSEEHADLHRDLDQVFYHLLGLGAVARVLLGDAVKIVQDLAAGVVDEHLDHRLVGHVAEDLLLGLHGHVLGAEGLHGYLRSEQGERGWRQSPVRLVLSAQLFWRTEEKNMGNR